MEYLNNGSIKRTLNKILIAIITLFVVSLIIKGVIVLIPICIVGVLGYKGIKFINSKIKNTTKTRSNGTGEFKYNIKEEYNSNSKVIDVEYEDVNR